MSAYTSIHASSAALIATGIGVTLPWHQECKVLDQRRFSLHILCGGMVVDCEQKQSASHRIYRSRSKDGPLSAHNGKGVGCWVPLTSQPRDW